MSYTYIIRGRNIFKCYDKQTEEECKLAVQKNGFALQNIENQTDEICKLAVQQNGLALQYVKNQTEAICKLAVQQNILVIKIICNQTEEICELAVQQNGMALQYVRLEIYWSMMQYSCLYNLYSVVQKYGCVFKYIQNKTNEICKLAVQQNGLAIQFVKNKTEEICKLAFEQNEKSLEYVPIEIRLKILSWKIIDKLLESNEEKMCSISYENIELNDEYCRCLTCSTIYKADVLITWVMNGQRNKTCPMCRTFWPLLNHIKYCNK